MHKGGKVQARVTGRLFNRKTNYMWESIKGSEVQKRNKMCERTHKKRKK